MSITLRGGTTGPNSNASSTSISLPSGVAVGDVSFLCYVQAQNSPTSNTMATFTPPSGWTVLHNNGCVVVCWRAFQTGDATTGITCSSSRSDWWESACVTYTGLDTTSPVDASNFSNQLSISDTFTTYNNTIVAPSLNPNFNGSQLLAIMCECGSSSGTLNTPSGMTSRASSTSGPMVRISDLALTDGTPTGPKTATNTNNAHMHFGMQIALKASGAAGATLAAAMPIVCGRINDNTNGASRTINLDWMNVQDGDLVVVWGVNGDSSHPTYVLTPPAGWTTHLGAGSGMLFSRKWSTGDSKTPAFTLTGAAYVNLCSIVIRKTGVSALAVNVDQVSANTYSGSTSLTGTAPSLTPAQTHELLLVLHGVGTANATTWSSITGGLTDEDIQTSSGPGSRFSWLQDAPSPSGTFSATGAASGSLTMTSAALLAMIGTPGGGGGAARPVVMVCT